MISRVGKKDDGRENFSDVDLSKLSFPTDKLTVDVLRKAHPELFDQWNGPGAHEQPKFFCEPLDIGHTADTLGSMCHCERLTALTAYLKEKGLEPPCDDETVELFQEDLAKRYMRYGLAKGPHHVAELIRDIERQGRELAIQRQP